MTNEKLQKQNRTNSIGSTALFGLGHFERATASLVLTIERVRLTLLVFLSIQPWHFRHMPMGL